MSLKIGIITIVKVNNYGAELQAYALQQKLKDMGYNAEIIDYLYYKNWRFRDTAMSSPWIPLSFREKILYFLKYRIGNFLIDKIFSFFSKSVFLRKQRFALFHKENTDFSPAFRSMQELYRYSFDYDIYMVGSDQVWNPASSSSIEPYFLTFAPRYAKKLSYASSFGVSELPSYLQSRYAACLAAFQAVSVRESTGVVLAQRLFPGSVAQVVDPTLLLDTHEWKACMKLYNGMPKSYVLIYQLSDTQKIVEIALHIGKMKNIPVYRICKRAFMVDKNEGIINILDAGPAEFLSLIYHASYMITDSFHGTAFAVNFGIPLYTVVSSRQKNNGRMQSLLTQVGMCNRLLNEETDATLLNIDNHVDYKEVELLIDKARKRSIQFLKEVCK